MSWAEALEKYGFKREIAGDEDFNAGVNALESLWEHYRLLDEAKERGALLVPRRKGIIAAGGYGVGKTCFMDAVSKMFRKYPLYRIDLSLPDEVRKLSGDWMEYYACNLYTKHVYLDDLGAELSGNDYGVRFEAVTQFISAYHVRSKGSLFITTNLTGEEIDERYNGRILSRLKELCIPLHFKGKDKRRWLV